MGRSTSKEIQERWLKKIGRLTEALPISIYRPYAEIDRTQAQSRLSTIWPKLEKLADFTSKSKDRLYFKRSINSEPVSTGLDKEYKMYYYELFADIIAGEEGMEKKRAGDSNIKIPDQTVNLSVLKRKKDTFPITTYNGITFDGQANTVTIGRRVFKIGTLINNYLRADIFSKAMQRSIQSHFQDYNRVRSNYKFPAQFDGYVVLTGHPYDVAGKASDRAFKSCMMIPATRKKAGSKPDGDEYLHLQCDIEQGTFEGYFVREDDLNINNPIGRVSIKPFFNPDSNTVSYFVEKRAYGEASTELRQKVEEILNSVRTIEAGTYKLAPSLYADSLSAVHNGKEVGPFATVSDFDATGTDLSDIELYSTVFKGNTSFKDATLHGVNFNKATLIKANFTGADLQNATFKSSNLTRAIFTGADLEGADFNNATVDGADFRTAIHLEKALNMEKVKSNTGTKWPKT